MTAANATAANTAPPVSTRSLVRITDTAFRRTVFAFIPRPFLHDPRAKVPGERKNERTQAQPLNFGFLFFYFEISKSYSRCTGRKLHSKLNTTRRFRITNFTRYVLVFILNFFLSDDFSR